MTDTKTRAAARRFAIQVVSGAVLGFAGSCFFGPGVLGWWYAPPVKDAFSCESSVRNALTQFVKMQLISAAVGAVVVLIAVFLIRRAFTKRGPNVAAPSTGV